MCPMDLYRDCRLCPRACGVNRTDNGAAAERGFCRETDQMRVGYVGPHFGEEPPISGTNGSGAIFFAGCALRCSFCQNHQISRQGMGEKVGMTELVARAKQMIYLQHVHNINLVTPDHFLPHSIEFVSLLRKGGLDLPVVYNLSGYQSVEMLKVAEEHVDIYLPDYKFSDPSLASRLSKCRGYPGAALEAISEMLRQKGFIDSVLTGKAIAKRGVLVRHLILPGCVENSINALTSLFVEFGRDLPISIMSQYHPVLGQAYDFLNRFISEDEFEQVYSHARELGFVHMFVQFPVRDRESSRSSSSFLPDFRDTEPFS